MPGLQHLWLVLVPCETWRSCCPRYGISTTGEGICDCIVPTMNMSDVLSDEREVALLSWGPVLRATSKCKSKGFVVCVDMKVSSL